MQECGSESAPKHLVLGVAALGDYTSYKTVFYRTYYYKEGSSRKISRKSVVVATRFSFLAPLAANVIKFTKSCGNVPEIKSALVLYIPITLFNGKFELENKHLKLKELALHRDDQKNYLHEYCRHLVMKVLKDLSNLTKEDVKLARSLLRGNYGVKDSEESNFSTKLGKQYDIYAVELNINHEECLEEPKPIGTSDVFQAAYKGALRIVNLGRESPEQRNAEEKDLTVELTLYLHVVPLSMTIYSQEHMIIIRDPKNGNLNEVLRMVMLYTFDKILRRELRNSQTEVKEDNRSVKLTIVADTSHGVNFLSNALAGMIRSYRLIASLNILSVLRQGTHNSKQVDSENHELVLYNSDPLPYMSWESRRSDQNAITKLTLECQMAHHIVERYRLSMKDVHQELVPRLKYAGININSQKGIDTLLRGLVLLTHGIISWGLYYISIFDNKDNSSPPSVYLEPKQPREDILRGRSTEKDKIEVVEIEIKASNYDYEDIFKKILARTVYEVIKSDIDEVLLKDADAGKVCWSGLEIGREVRCFDLSKIKEKLEIGDEQGSLSILLDPTTRHVVLHEINTWINRTISRIRYFAKIGRDQRYMFEPPNIQQSELPNMCLTPLTVPNPTDPKRNDVRNFIAHAGLSPITKSMAILVRRVSSSEDEKACHTIAICIAGDLPKKVIKEIVAEAMVQKD